jgi:hypothetical protein
VTSLVDHPAGDDFTAPRPCSMFGVRYRPTIHGPRQQGPQSRFAPAEQALLDEIENVRRWYINSQGQTLTVISNPLAKNATGIDYGFAIASHEVTVVEFLRFREGHDVFHLAAPSEDCPVGNVSWNMADEYCNWLSEKGAIPEDQWVYEQRTDDPADGMISKENYRELRGYRLPKRTTDRRDARKLGDLLWLNRERLYSRIVRSLISTVDTKYARAQKW